MYEYFYPNYSHILPLLHPYLPHFYMVHLLHILIICRSVLFACTKTFYIHQRIFVSVFPIQ